MRKDPCRGAYHSKRSKLGPNPHHNSPPMNKVIQDRRRKRSSQRKTEYRQQITNFHFHKIITWQIKRTNVRTFHKSNQKSVATKSQQSLQSQNLQSKERRHDFHKKIVKAKETKTDAERPSTGPFRKSQTITGNTPSRDKTFTHL